MLMNPLPTCCTRRWLAAAILGTTLALAACGDATGPLPREGAPAEMEFSIGGFGTHSTTVEVRGDTVVWRRAPWDWGPGSKVDSVRVVPAPEAWRAFWTVAERTGVRNWRRRYMAENIADGVGWGLRIRADGRQIRSEGSNAYPDRKGREHEGEMTGDFQAFRAALGDLVGRPL